MACAGSVEAESGVLDTGSSYASEGSAAHELAEKCLSSRNGMEWSPDQFLGSVIKPKGSTMSHVVDREMVDAISQYIDYVRSLKGTAFYEVKVDLTPWIPEGFGTSDCIVVNNSTITVVDLKYGKGVAVEAEDNPQLKLYALGALESLMYIYELDRVVIVAHQPRRDSVSEWGISVKDLLAWGEEVKRASAKALEPDAPRSPGEKQCKFCKAKATCPALLKVCQETVLANFDSDPMTIPDGDKLSDETLGKVLSNRKLIVDWLGAIEALVTERLQSGKDFPGWKLVAGRANRSWTDVAEAESVLTAELGDKAFERALLSVPKAEKALGKSKVHVIENLIGKGEGKPTLAPESDSRPTLNITANTFNSFD